MKAQHAIFKAIDVAGYSRNQEDERIRDLIRVTPKGRASVLDIGARDGRISLLLAPHFKIVTALDIVRPDIRHRKVQNVRGDVTRLDLPDDSFDVVLCAELLEHIRPELLEQACAEIVRVARCDVVIGVPYKQDLRLGRTVCLSCGKKNPPWGHVNIFDEDRLMRLFRSLTCVGVSFAGKNGVRTNPISTFLMDLGGNPWGTYLQEERCIYCGGRLVQPSGRTVSQKMCSDIALLFNRIQGYCTPGTPTWIHMVFMKRPYD